MNMNFYMSSRIITGMDCVINNTVRFKELGNKCLIVTGYYSAKKCGALDDIMSVIKRNNSTYIIYDKIRQNPTVKSCLEAGKLAHNEKVDYIVGIGGGSPLDASKAIAIAATNPEITEDMLYNMSWTNKPLPIIAVGTTAGTGSEVTSVSVLTNSKGMKKSFRNDEVYPLISFGDPKYTMTLSDNFTRSTAVDALAHCTESYFNCNANEISRSFAVSGIKILLKVFTKIKEYGTESLNYDDRENLYNASIFGGLAISVTGTAFPHALGYFLTENYGLSHGTACALYIPEFIEYNLSVVPKYTDEFLKEIGSDKDSFIKAVKSITPKTNIKLTDLEIKSLSPRWIGNTGLKRTIGNPDEQYVNSLLKKLFI